MKIDLDRRYAEIPFLFIMKELGSEIEYVNNNIVKIKVASPLSNNGKNIYILDTESCKLVFGRCGNSVFDEEISCSKDYIESEFNLFDLVVGRRAPRFTDTINGEFIIDSSSMKYALGINFHITVDFDNNRIIIEP